MNYNKSVKIGSVYFYISNTFFFKTQANKPWRVNQLFELALFPIRKTARIVSAEKNRAEEKPHCFSFSCIDRITIISVAYLAGFLQWKRN